MDNGKSVICGLKKPGCQAHSLTLNKLRPETATKFSVSLINKKKVFFVGLTKRGFKNGSIIPIDN